MLHQCICRYCDGPCMINVPHATQTPLLGSQKDCCPESHITFQRFASVIRHFFFFFLRYTWCIRNCLWGGACCSNHGDHARDKAWRYMATTAGTVKFKLLPVLLFYRISCSLVVQVLESRARSVKLRLKKRCWCTKALCDLALKLCCFC